MNTSTAPLAPLFALDLAAALEALAAEVESVTDGELGYALRGLAFAVRNESPASFAGCAKELTEVLANTALNPGEGRRYVAVQLLIGLSNMQGSILRGHRNIGHLFVGTIAKLSERRCYVTDRVGLDF